jgi:hypothetical protein
VGLGPRQHLRGGVLRHGPALRRHKLEVEAHLILLHDLLWGLGSAPNDVYVVGSQGKIQHFNGSMWSTTAPAGNSAIFKDVWGSGPKDVYAVGNGGKIYHFNGSKWMPQTGPSVALDAVWGTSAGCVYVAGNSGQIWSRDSTSGWKKMNSTTSYGLMDIHTCAAGTYVVGSLNTVLRLQP